MIYKIFNTITKKKEYLNSILIYAGYIVDAVVTIRNMKRTSFLHL